MKEYSRVLDDVVRKVRGKNELNGRTDGAGSCSFDPLTLFNPPPPFRIKPPSDGLVRSIQSHPMDDLVSRCRVECDLGAVRHERDGETAEILGQAIDVRWGSRRQNAKGQRGWFVHSTRAFSSLLLHDVILRTMSQG